MDSAINLLAEGVSEAFLTPQRVASGRYDSSSRRERGHVSGRGRGYDRGSGRGHILTDADLASKHGGRSGDKWYGEDISNLRASFAPSVFNKFQGWLIAKISKPKKGTDFSRLGTSENYNVDTASVHTELAQIRAVMQASVDNHQLPPIPLATATSVPSDNSIVATQNSTGVHFGSGSHRSDTPNKRPKL